MAQIKPLASYNGEFSVIQAGDTIDPAFLEPLTLTGQVTGTGTGAIVTTIAAGAVTLANMANIATNRIIGRSAAGTGAPESIVIGPGLILAGGNLSGAVAGGSGSELQFRSSGAFDGAATTTWDNVNNRLGIGTLNPLATLDVRSADGMFYFNSEIFAQRSGDSFFIAPAVNFKRTRGTIAVPTAPITGDFLGDFYFRIQTNEVLAGFGARVENASLGAYLYFSTAASPNSGTNPPERMRITSAGDVMIGSTSGGARFNVTATGQQMRLNYDVSNYMSVGVSLTGVTTFTATGTGASFTFSQAVSGPTAALGTNTTQLATTAYTLAAVADNAPTKTGTNASGTWAIGITGSAALLGGQNGAYYLDLANATGTLAAARFPAFTGDVTTSAGTVATTIAAGVVTYAKLANIATNTLIGRATAGIGVPEAITIGTGLSMAAGVLSATASGGTVTSVSVVTANGISGTVATATSTPAITLTLGAITPTSISTTGRVVIGPFDNGATRLAVAADAAGSAFSVQHQAVANGDTVVSVVMGNTLTGAADLIKASGSASGNLNILVQQNGTGNGVIQSTVLGVGDSLTIWNINGGQSWTAGLDNSDNDRFKIASGAELGINDCLVISPTTLNIMIPGGGVAADNGDRLQVTGSISATSAISAGGAITGNILNSNNGGNFGNAAGNSNTQINIAPNGPALYSVIDMRGTGNSSALGLNILAGQSSAYLSTGTFYFRNAAQTVTYATLSATGLAVTGTLSATGAITQAGNQVWHAGNDSGLVHIAGTETITGIKTFTSNVAISGTSTFIAGGATGLNWDGANSRLGIGTASPTAVLDVRALDGIMYYTQELFMQRSGDQFFIAPAVNFKRTRGTIAAPTAPISGDKVGDFYFRTDTNTVSAGFGAAFENASLGAYIHFDTGEVPNATVERMRITAPGNIVIGATVASARLHVVSTTQQLRLGYDVSNYMSATVSAAGAVTLASAGTGSRFDFTSPVGIPTSTPASAAATGVTGTVAWDVNYIYVCIATNSWKRVAIAAW